MPGRVTFLAGFHKSGAKRLFQGGEILTIFLVSPDPPMLSNRNQLLEREVPKASRWKGRSSWREGGAPPTSSPSPK